MHRILAIIEREVRRFRRSPLLVGITVLGPLLQLVVLGYAFGGTLHGLRLALVDEDHGVPALEIRALANSVGASARTFETIPYDDEAHAIDDLRQGRVNGVLTIPPGYSRRVLAGDDPKVAYIENNSDRFVATALEASLSELVSTSAAARVETRRVSRTPRLEAVELFPFVPYIQYLLPGTVVLAIFTMVMLGGAFSFMDDKTLGLHEGYLVTPLTKLEMVTGFTVSGAVKAMIAGSMLLVIGLPVAGIERAFEPVRLLEMLAVVAATSLALVSLMFMLVARVEDPMVPRIASQLLSTLLYFPSGAVYPTQAFPGWMRAIAAVDPFTYAVHAFKCLLLKDTGLLAVSGDLLYLGLFTVAAMTAATLLFRRTL